MKINFEKLKASDFEYMKFFDTEEKLLQYMQDTIHIMGMHNTRFSRVQKIMLCNLEKILDSIEP